MNSAPFSTSQAWAVVFRGGQGKRRGTLCSSESRRRVEGSIISRSWLIQRQWWKEKRGAGGGRRGSRGSARVFSLGCVVYKQTWGKQSGEECEGREKGVQGGKKKGVGRGGGTRGQGPLSLAPSALPLSLSLSGSTKERGRGRAEE